MKETNRGFKEKGWAIRIDKAGLDARLRLLRIQIPKRRRRFEKRAIDLLSDETLRMDGETAQIHPSDTVYIIIYLLSVYSFS